MEISSFAIWKFRYVEGFLQGFHSFDLETSKYVDPFTFATTWIRYNFKAETAEIERPDGTKIEVSFSGHTCRAEYRKEHCDSYRQEPS